MRTYLYKVRVGISRPVQPMAIVPVVGQTQAVEDLRRTKKLTDLK